MKMLSVKPTSPSIGRGRWFDFAVRLLVLNAGLLIIGLAITATLKSGLGLSAWDVFHSGLSQQTGLTIGQIIQLTGLAIIGLNWLLRVRPALGTLVNMVLVGLWIDLFNASPLSTGASLGLVGQIGYLLAGIVLLGLGIAIEFQPRLGGDPRDSLMLTLAWRNKWKLARTRQGIELCVGIIGWLLGGPVGIGTFLMAALVGPSIEFFFKLLHVQIEQ